jgi:hypothetical protein
MLGHHAHAPSAKPPTTSARQSCHAPPCIRHPESRGGSIDLRQRRPVLPGGQSNKDRREEIDMTDKTSSAPRSSTPSLARLIALARLSERFGRRDPRRILLDRILRQSLLFSRMADRLGLAAPTGPLMRAIYREAELGCLECRASNRCRRWLDGKAPEDDYQEFCPNEGLFSVLPRQNNVTRPYGPE